MRVMVKTARCCSSNQQMQCAPVLCILSISVSFPCMLCPLLGNVKLISFANFFSRCRRGFWWRTTSGTTIVSSHSLSFTRLIWCSLEVWKTVIWLSKSACDGCQWQLTRFRAGALIYSLKAHVCKLCLLAKLSRIREPSEIPLHSLSRCRRDEGFADRWVMVFWNTKG